MTDKFNPVSIEQLFRILTHETKNSKGFLGIPKGNFIIEKKYQHFHSQIFGQHLDFPLGVAAGPHSQLSQNIISAWLCGARYIELKTIQTLDELKIEKPCIDMQDEGYNCEWSQELKIKDTFNQYLDAWILLHIINHQWGFRSLKGTIFNMSVGYNLEGILNENVQWFFSKMQNCNQEKLEKIALLKSFYPQIEDLEIPDTISNNITLSTMHGCPPDEIEKIASYLIEQKKLHTFIKLNPTLLGPTELRKILNTIGRFDTKVPDEAFEHDLKYPDALKMITSISKKAHISGVEFGLKLTNTLESINHKQFFSGAQMMYMSGRALHPISVNVARQLQNQFNGSLTISFAGGADAFNFSDLVGCGLAPITVSTDILKPGGYMRLNQYLEELDKNFTAHHASSINEFTCNRAGMNDLRQARLKNLNQYADKVLIDKKYQKHFIRALSIKGTRKLQVFDCIEAPCRENCATSQDIPEYLNFAANNNFNEAFTTILHTNPQPGITGNICDHLCQLRCTRINYDDSLKIRELKRFIEENHEESFSAKTMPENGIKVAIIGAGPSGLSCAYYLREAGFSVDLFEKSAQAGGMVAAAVPEFRLENEKLQRDIQRVLNMGTKIHYLKMINSQLFNELQQSFNYVYIATGAPLSASLLIPGINSQGVIEPLEFLFQAKLGHNPILGKKVAIIGGGNTAMDAARVANRLVGDEGSVDILYRRTIQEMPADIGEIQAVIDEGIKIHELVAPEEVQSNDGKVVGLKCSKMVLVQEFKSDRMKPQKVPGSEFVMNFNCIIPAVGQNISIDFMDETLFSPNSETFETKLKKVFTGGDVMRGAATAIKAIADGRKVAQKIINECQIKVKSSKIQSNQLNYDELMNLRSKRIFSVPLKESPLFERKTFNPVSYSLEKEEAQNEASRCLQCQQLCNICVTVCPNRANYHYTVEPCEIKLYKAIRGDKESSFEFDTVVKLKQEHQILNIADFCNECGNCTTFCPTSGAPYRDKPKFYLTIQSFNKAEEGYFLSKLKDKQILIYKEHGGIRTLELKGEEWIYETDHVKAIFKKAGFELYNVDFKVPCAQQVHFNMAVEMKILYHAAENLC